jgi:hypothetical protein
LLSIGRTDTNEYSFYLDINDTDYGSLAQTMWVYWNSGGSLNSLVPKTGSNVIGGTSYGDWNDSTWRCYIFTRSVTDSPYTKHYMNGLEVTNVTRQNDQTTKFGNGAGYQITLGAYRSNNLNFAGNQSIVRIYNKVLSPQEVIQNFESQRVNYGITGITTNGLVLNLDAANTASYNGSGTTWVDISGSEFDGTLINGPTYGNSGATSNILLDGIDDFISGNTLTNLMNGSTTLTLIIWIYPTNLNNTDAGGSGYKTLVDTPNRHLSLWLGTQGKGQYYGIGGTTGSYTTNFNWENNKWQMVTIIANSSDGQIIKNNYDVSQTVGKGNTFTQQITFGNNPSTGGSNLEGRYGGIQLYNRALSVAEVSQNYNAQKSRFGL